MTAPFTPISVLLDVLSTKKTVKEQNKIRQAIAATISYLDALHYCLGDIKK